MSQYNTWTVGVDIGDRYSKICVLDEVAEIFEESRIRTTREAVSRYFSMKPPMRIVMEVGTHSPWMSRLVKEQGHEVLVANARKLRLIYDDVDKDDRLDAEKLARIGRLDPKLLAPLEHRSEETQSTRALIKSRDVMVRSRSNLVNSVRGTVKSMGYRMPSCSTESFHKQGEHIPEVLAEVLIPVMESIAFLTARIKDCERKIDRLCEERYPETRVMRQVPGVGPVTSLAYVVTIEDPARFPNSRDVGPYLGIRPKRDQTGESDPELHITKAGDSYLRRLLVGSAHYILGPFGPDTDLRRWGLELAARGGKKAKRRAVVAVARKLSVLLLSLWKTGEVYEPLRNTKKKMEGKSNKREAA